MDDNSVTGNQVIYTKITHMDVRLNSLDKLYPKVFMPLVKILIYIINEDILMI